MNQEKKDLLSLRNLPARLGIGEAAWLLGFGENDIPVLMSAGLLKALGRPTTTGSKYFATVDLQNFGKDPRWLAKASDAVVHHWRDKNASRRLITNRIPNPSLAGAGLN